MTNGSTSLEYVAVPARGRPAFHDQPDADLRQRQAAARPRAAADLPRIQLHDPPGLRLPRAVAPRRAAGCRWAAPTSGAISSTASSSARRIDGTEVFGLTTPLITTADGAKMGKTAQGAVWLNADQLSPYDYWQFWRNTARRRRRPVPAPVHRPAAGRDRAAGERCRAPRSTRPRSCWRPKRRRCCTAARPRATAKETAKATFEQGGAGEDLPTLSASATASTSPMR